VLVRRLPLITSLCLIASGAFASTALAAHESNNRFDFKPTAAAPGADGRGVRNYLAGPPQRTTSSGTATLLASLSARDRATGPSA
jgi:hypothetical protein